MYDDPHFLEFAIKCLVCLVFFLWFMDEAIRKLGKR